MGGFGGEQKVMGNLKLRELKWQAERNGESELLLWSMEATRQLRVDARHYGPCRSSQLNSARDGKRSHHCPCQVQPAYAASRMYEGIFTNATYT